MDNAGHVIIAVVTGLIGLSALAIVLSNQANTNNVLNTGFTGLSNVLKTVISPISGNSTAL